MDLTNARFVHIARHKAKQPGEACSEPGRRDGAWKPSASLPALCGRNLRAVREEIPDRVSAQLQPGVQAYVLALMSGMREGQDAALSL